MKFLHLRSALESALESKKRLATIILKSVQSQEDNSGCTGKKPPRPFYSPSSTRSKLLTDNISRDPVDKTAARVIAKAPEWAKLIDYGTTNEQLEAQRAVRKSCEKDQSNYQKLFPLVTNKKPRKSKKSSPPKRTVAYIQQIEEPEPTVIEAKELMDMLLAGAITANEFNVLCRQESPARRV